MNRKHWFITLAFVLLLAIFGAAKWTAKVSESWRPIIIGKVKEADTIFEASDHYLSVYGNKTDVETWFDLKTGSQYGLNADSEGVVPPGDWKWKFKTGHKLQLGLNQVNGPTKFYDCPDYKADGMRPYAPDWIRVSADSNRFETLLMNRYYRWELNSRRIERNVPFVFSNGPIAPDGSHGDALIQSSAGAIDFVSTRSGKVVRRVRLPKGYEVKLLSPLGAYAICVNSIGNSPNFDVLIVNTHTGRVLWKFKQGLWMGHATFCADETLFAISPTERQIWEVRDTKTGAVVSTIPRVRDAYSDALSPDGNTLYSVANGILYRQRALNALLAFRSGIFGLPHVVFCKHSTTSSFRLII